jgi:hypothetical protein
MAERERKARRALARARPLALAGLGPSGEAGKKETGRTRGRQAGASGGLLGQKPKERKFSFSFSFSYISKHFQIILNPLLNLKSNHSIQKFKCNSMSA